MGLHVIDYYSVDPSCKAVTPVTELQLGVQGDFYNIRFQVRHFRAWPFSLSSLEWSQSNLAPVGKMEQTLCRSTSRDSTLCSFSYDT